MPRSKRPKDTQPFSKSAWSEDLGRTFQLLVAWILLIRTLSFLHRPCAAFCSEDTKLDYFAGTACGEIAEIVRLRGHQKSQSALRAPVHHRHLFMALWVKEEMSIGLAMPIPNSSWPPPLTPAAPLVFASAAAGTGIIPSRPHYCGAAVVEFANPRHDMRGRLLRAKLGRHELHRGGGM